MARTIRFPGLVSLVLVSDQHEIDDLVGHPALAREFKGGGPLLNRLLLGRAQRSMQHDGRTLISFWPRQNGERAQAQNALTAHLNALAPHQPWDPEAIGLMARYVATGEAKNRAGAALTYATAFPFLAQSGGQTGAPFDEKTFARAFQLYQRLAAARGGLSPRGLFARLTGGARRARNALSALTEGSDYGLHALMITLDNSLVMLENLRTQAGQIQDLKRPRTLDFAWASIRTSSDTVLRQVHETVTLPHVAARLPAGTLVVFSMRRSLTTASPTGFEFAATHWSACPAQAYIMSLFRAVSEAAAPLILKRTQS